MPEVKTPKEIVDAFIPPDFDRLNIYRDSLEKFAATIQTDAQAHLLDRIKALEVSLSNSREVIAAFASDAEGASILTQRNELLDRCDNQKSQLNQAHTALKCALAALEGFVHGPYTASAIEINQRFDSGRKGIALIHACVIGGETKEHPALAILRRNLGYLRTDSTRDDYLEACRLFGLKP